MREGIREAENLLAADRADFTFPTATQQWAPPRHYDIQHLKMDFKIDLKNEHVDALSTLRLTSIVPELKRIFLHAMDLRVSSVKDSKGNTLHYEMVSDDQAMYINLAKILKEGDSEELTFAYTIEKPRTGLYFTNPSP